MTLGDSELERYARQIVLPQMGGVGQQRLRRAKVAVVGAGGIGCAVLPSLAAAGVGALTIIDDSAVELANLHRQTVYREADIGSGKAEAAAAFVRARNANVTVQPVAERLTGENARRLLEGHDLVIDGSDNFATRLVIADCCVGMAVPLISAAAVQFQGQVGLWTGHVADQACYRCFVGDAFDAEDCDNCAELGILGPLAAAAGSHAAMLAILDLAQIGEPEAGVIHLLDGLSLKWRQIRVAKDPACPACFGFRRKGDQVDERPVQPR